MANALGKRIRSKRLDLGLSQAELGHRARIAPKWVERMEAASGSINPKLATLLAIAGALGVTVSWLLAEEDAPRPPREKPLGKYQKRLMQVAKELGSKEARLLVKTAEYMLTSTKKNGLTCHERH